MRLCRHAAELLDALPIGDQRAELARDGTAPWGLDHLRRAARRRVGDRLLRALRPTLGLDLQGGASVISRRPRHPRRRDAAGAREHPQPRGRVRRGEPDIAVSGTTIEVQIPGSADATIRRPERGPVVSRGRRQIHGCSENDDDVRDVLDSLEVQSQPSEVCVLDGGGEQVECFTSRAQAQTFLDGIEVVPKRRRARARRRARRHSRRARRREGPRPRPAAIA